MLQRLVEGKSDCLMGPSCFVGKGKRPERECGDGCSAIRIIFMLSNDTFKTTEMLLCCLYFSIIKVC